MRSDLCNIFEFMGEEKNGEEWASKNITHEILKIKTI